MMRCMSDETAGTKASDIVRRHFESFGHGGLEDAAELWDPDIEWRAVEGVADDVGVIRGWEAMRAYYAEWVEAMEDLRADVCEVIFEDGERVAVHIRNSGRGRVSGAPAAGNYYVACLVKDGRIAVGREFAIADQAVAAAQALEA